MNSARGNQKDRRRGASGTVEVKSGPIRTGTEKNGQRREGPKDAFPDGTRYEYDSRFKTTFEITPSGGRFPVGLVAGEFQRRSAKLEPHKSRRQGTAL